MRIALAQINTTVGDLRGNARKVLAFGVRAKSAGADLMLTPELALTGYPPQDLLFSPQFVADQLEILNDELATELALPTLVGVVDRLDNETKTVETPGALYNAAAFVAEGKVRFAAAKALLPTYDVFDEWRYFSPCLESSPLTFGGQRLGVTICEDLWDDGYALKVAPQLRSKGAQIILNLSSSPYHFRKGKIRKDLMRRHAIENGLPVLYCNLVGAQDELIFDGHSLCLNAAGKLVAEGRQFEEDLLVVDWDVRSGQVTLVEQAHGASTILGTEIDGDPDGSRELFAALCLGIRDYFSKCGFKRAVIGLSGGIDSALTACLAAEALGPAQVIGVAMPSHNNASYSLDDAQELASNLGIEFFVAPIEDSVQLAMQRFRAVFGEYRDGLTVENLQARERGKTLMEISNDRRALVLSTGNKTEYALGYTTLYGDMCGGLAVLGDLDKPGVYRLSNWYNAERRRLHGMASCIPERTISRPPSAELREGQVDPFDYSRISPLTDLVVEEHVPRKELLARGYLHEEIDLVLRLVRISEYKRWQAAPVLRVSEKAFGIGRRMPIVNHYEE